MISYQLCVCVWLVYKLPTLTMHSPISFLRLHAFARSHSHLPDRRALCQWCGFIIPIRKSSKYYYNESWMEDAWQKKNTELHNVCSWYIVKYVLFIVECVIDTFVLLFNSKTWRRHGAPFDSVQCIPANERTHYVTKTPCLRTCAMFPLLRSEFPLSTRASPEMLRCINSISILPWRGAVIILHFKNDIVVVWVRSSIFSTSLYSLTFWNTINKWQLD